MKKALFTVFVIAIVFCFVASVAAAVGAGTVTATGACQELSGAETDNITVRCPTRNFASSVLSGIYTKGDETSFAITFRHAFVASGNTFAAAFQQMDLNAVDKSLEKISYKLLPANYAAAQPLEFKIYHPTGAVYVYITFTPTGGTPTGTITNVDLN